MTCRIGINGFGRMGRLLARAVWDLPELHIAHINEVSGGAACAAHLLKFDSIHGQWPHAVEAQDDAIVIDGDAISFSAHADPAEIPWAAHDVDLVLECSGQFRSTATLQAHLDAGAGKVLVAAPVKEKGVPNIVMGINDGIYDPVQHAIATAASCTTNCLAPVVKVIHEAIGIRHGVITTIHAATNTQRVVDAPHKDLRRARSSSVSLIPTSTGSATAIGWIYPELDGKLDGLAVRVPLQNASILDAVFEVARSVDADEVNGLFAAAAAGPLAGILGYETRPLVSADFTNDVRSGVVDALSTRVVDGTSVKVLAWYDNEMGYVQRMAELAVKMARTWP